MTRESSRDVDARAAAWAARLDAGPLSAEAAAALAAWTAGDPRRAGALARAQAVLALFDAAADGPAGPARGRWGKPDGGGSDSPSAPSQRCAARRPYLD